MNIAVYRADRKLDFFVRNPIISLSIIASVGLLLRLYYFPYNVPLIFDALRYFLYGTDVTLLGHLPHNFYLDNNGWPVFLSFFFAIFRFDNVFDYMTLQRAIAVSISVLTIIPVYFLCNKYFDRSYAIAGAAIIAFDPRLIQNSFLGITEPLYILLITSAIVIFLSSNAKMIFASFAIVGLATLVRSEGQFVFFAMLVMLFVRHKNMRERIVRCVIAVGTFTLSILPMSILRIQVNGTDSITSRALGDTSGVLLNTLHSNNLLTYFITATENIVKLSAWSLVPTFIFLIPVSFFLIFKERRYTTTTIIVIMIAMFLPILYEFSFIPDPRYMYPLFPVFCVLSLFSLKRLNGKFKSHNIVLVLALCGILLSSGIFLDLKKYDYEHQREAFRIAQYVDSVAKGINEYYPEYGYTATADLPQKWPALSSSIPAQPVIIPTKGFDSLEKFITASRNEGLTHLVIDDNPSRPNFLKDVFHHEEKYPYLEKIFDSKLEGYNYHVKIFKINYNKLGSQ